MLVLDPMDTLLPSPRMVELYHTLEDEPMDTSPTMFADGAMNAVSGLIVGAMLLTATKRVDGTRRSVYLATSIAAPILSRVLPRLLAVFETAVTTLAPMVILNICY